VVYISSTEEFVSHTTCYELKVMDWATREVKVVVPIKDTIEEGEEFGGLYGYNFTYMPTGFIGDSNRYVVLTSEF
jgi:hypothetical protein